MTRSPGKFFFLLFYGAAVLLFRVPAGAAEPDPLFQQTELLDITLTGPFSRIDRERDKDNKYRDATLTYRENGRDVSLNVKLSVRGNFRLRKNVCSYSQLWVDFDKDQTNGTLFTHQNKLKLVVQCNKSSNYEAYIVREDQAYRMFNALTDISFRTRLLNVTYRDSENGESRTHKGIFIEHKKRLARRVDLDNTDLEKIPVAGLDPQQANLTDMFMFMVANTDYSIISAPPDDDGCCHNVKLFQSSAGKYFPAPYDFDSSGYVDTSYAKPNVSLHLRSNRQRLYRGFCFPQDIVDNTLTRFRAQQERILGIAADTAFVNGKKAAGSVKFLQKFFDIINDPAKLKKKILDECRG